MSLKKKLIIAVLATMILMIAVNTIVIQSSTSLLSNNTKKVTSNLSKDVQSDVKGFSEHYVGTLIYHESENSKKAIQQLINDAEKRLTTISSFAEIYSGDSQSMKSLFNKFVKQDKMIRDIYLRRGNSFIHTSSNKEQSRSIDWFNGAKKLKKEKFYISKPQFDTNKKQYYISISTPVYQNNQFLGVLGMDLSLDQLSEEIANKKVGSTGYVILTDSKGTILAYKDQDLVKKKKNISSLPFFKDNKDGLITLNLDKVTYLLVTEENTGWNIFSIIPHEELLSFSETIGKNMSDSIKDAEKNTSKILSRLLLIETVIIIVLIGAAVIISISLAKYFTKPISHLVSFLQKVTNGDLSEKVAVKSKDEIGILYSSVNTMVDSLREMSKKLIQLVQKLEDDCSTLNKQVDVSSKVTETISSAMEELAKGTELLTTDMVNISTHIDSNNRFVDKMRDSINKIVEHAGKTKSITADGEQALKNMNTTIEAIVNQSVESSNIMNELNKKLHAINEITNLIYDIAEQTNLLSLNASIEAARAGEHGKGFAVVAQEVKKLAEESSNSVEKIASLVNEIQKDSEKALLNINQGKQSAIEGSKMTKESEKVFNNFFRFIDHLSNDIDEIAQASDQLCSSSESIAQSVNSIVSISEETNAGVQEVTSTSEEQNRAIHEVRAISESLHALSKELKSMLQHYKL